MELFLTRRINQYAAIRTSWLSACAQGLLALFCYIHFVMHPLLHLIESHTGGGPAKLTPVELVVRGKIGHVSGEISNNPLLRLPLSGLPHLQAAPFKGLQVFTHSIIVFTFIFETPITTYRKLSLVRGPPARAFL